LLCKALVAVAAEEGGAKVTMELHAAPLMAAATTPEVATLEVAALGSAALGSVVLPMVAGRPVVVEAGAGPWMVPMAIAVAAMAPWAVAEAY